MKALTIRQPWAWAIVHSTKRIENRTWDTGYVGPVLIHAAKGMTRREYALAEAYMDSFDGALLPGPTNPRMQRGGIVAVANLVDVILPGGMSTLRVYPGSNAARTSHRLKNDPWYTGGYGFVLDNVMPIPFIPCTGTLGLWDPVAVLSRAALEQLTGALKNTVYELKETTTP